MSYFDIGAIVTMGCLLDGNLPGAIIALLYFSITGLLVTEISEE